MSSSPKYADVDLGPSMQAVLEDLIGQRTAAVDEILNELLGTGLAGASLGVTKDSIIAGATQLSGLAEGQGRVELGTRLRSIAGRVHPTGLLGSGVGSLSTEQAVTAIRQEVSLLRHDLKEEQRQKLILETVAQAAGDLGYASRLAGSPDGSILLELTSPTGGMRGSVKETGDGSQLVWAVDEADTVESFVEGRIVRSCPATEEVLEAIHQRAEELGVEMGELEWEGKATTFPKEVQRGSGGQQRRTPRSGK